ncbi:hypothetical protein NUACC21_32240 [Scytonema sp. NUACC21]
MVKRYNESGLEYLGDKASAVKPPAYRRQLNQGKQPLVDDMQQAQFWHGKEEFPLLQNFALPSQIIG